MLGTKEWLLLLAPIALVWILLSIWLKRGRANRWLKISVAGMLTVFTVAFAATANRASEQARDVKSKRLEMERAANEQLLEYKRSKR